MKSVIKIVAIIALSLSVFAGNVFAQNPLLEMLPDDFKIYEVEAQVTGISAFGADPMDILTGAVAIPPEGVRMDMTFEGEVAGKINGAIKGIDFVTLYPDGRLDVDARATIETDDGHRIAVTVVGQSIPRSDEPIADLTERVKLSTLAEPYLWVNDLVLFGKGTVDLMTNTLNVEIFGIPKR